MRYPLPLYFLSFTIVFFFLPTVQAKEKKYDDSYSSKKSVKSYLILKKILKKKDRDLKPSSPKKSFKKSSQKSNHSSRRPSSSSIGTQRDAISRKIVEKKKKNRDLKASSRQKGSKKSYQKSRCPSSPASSSSTIPASQSKKTPKSGPEPLPKVKPTPVPLPAREPKIVLSPTPAPDFTPKLTPALSPTPVPIPVASVIPVPSPTPPTLIPIEIVLVSISNSDKGSNNTEEVADDFSIGKYNITAVQYAAFLNAVAKIDAYNLYHENMGSTSIVRSGLPGCYSYSVIKGYEELPITNVTWFNAARFCNWLENNQPSGEQGPRTTEQGTYDLSNVTDDVVTVKSDARWFLPSENQWNAYNMRQGIDSNAIIQWTSTLFNTEARELDSTPAYILSGSGEIADPSYASNNIGFRVATYSMGFDELPNTSTSSWMDSTFIKDLEIGAAVLVGGIITHKLITSISPLAEGTSELNLTASNALGENHAFLSSPGVVETDVVSQNSSPMQYLSSSRQIIADGEQTICANTGEKKPFGTPVNSVLASPLFTSGENISSPLSQDEVKVTDVGNHATPTKNASSLQQVVIDDVEKTSCDNIDEAKSLIGNILNSHVSKVSSELFTPNATVTQED